MAVTAYRKAIELKPKDAVAYNNLGVALRDQGKLAEAVAAYREAIHLNPDSPEAHSNLGAALAVQGKVVEAAAALKEAARLQPDDAKAEPLLRDALAMYRKLYPEARYPDGHPELARSLNNLGALLRDRGEYTKAEPLLRDALAMRRKLYEKLPGGHPELAQSLNSLAAVFQAQGKLGVAVADLRAQALDWLRADLAAWAKRVERDTPADRAAAVATLTRWHKDDDLAGVRHPWSLLRLPGDQRRAWQKFWADVDELLKKASKTGT